MTQFSVFFNVVLSVPPKNYIKLPIIYAELKLTIRPFPNGGLSINKESRAFFRTLIFRFFWFCIKFLSPFFPAEVATIWFSESIILQNRVRPSNKKSEKYHLGEVFLPPLWLRRYYPHFSEWPAITSFQFETSGEIFSIRYWLKRTKMSFCSHRAYLRRRPRSIIFVLNTTSFELKTCHCCSWSQFRLQEKWRPITCSVYNSQRQWFTNNFVNRNMFYQT